MIYFLFSRNHGGFKFDDETTDRMDFKFFFNEVLQFIYV